MSISAPPPPPPPTHNNFHNKSGCKGLTILNLTHDELMNMWREFCNKNSEIISTHFVITDGPIQDHPCWLTNTKDGKITANRVKLCFAYHLAAYVRYGRLNMANIPSVKSQDSLVVSHICWNGPCCCNPFHLWLESKRINDERTMCHASFRNAFNLNGYEGILAAYDAGICPHNPSCLFVRWMYYQ